MDYLDDADDAGGKGGLAALEAVSDFIACINGHDVAGLVELMTDDHLFIDSLGTAIRGREAMRGAWAGYFRWFPDYRVELEQMVARGDLVLLCGIAHATYGASAAPRPDDHWSAPAAWRAMVREGRIAEWQVYCDNEPARRVLAANA
jgi:ketosteroid isomerase-like protein